MRREVREVTRALSQGVLAPEVKAHGPPRRYNTQSRCNPKAFGAALFTAGPYKAATPQRSRRLAMASPTLAAAPSPRPSPRPLLGVPAGQRAVDEAVRAAYVSVLSRAFTLAAETFTLAAEGPPGGAIGLEGRGEGRGVRLGVSQPGGDSRTTLIPLLDSLQVRTTTRVRTRVRVRIRVRVRVRVSGQGPG